MQNSGREKKGFKTQKELLAKDPRLICVPFPQCWHALEGLFNHSNRSVVWLRKAGKLYSVHPADHPVHAGICPSPLQLWIKSVVLEMDECFDPTIAKCSIKKSFMMYVVESCSYIITNLSMFKPEKSTGEVHSRSPWVSFGRTLLFSVIETLANDTKLHMSKTFKHVV